MLLSGSLDCTTRIWNPISCRELIKPCKGHEDGVSSVAFSSDGRQFASGSFNGVIRVWDTKGGQDVAHLLDRGEGVHYMAFSPDGTKIVFDTDLYGIQVWDIGPHKVY